MKYVSHATCMICNKTFKKGNFDYVCPDHGDEGILDIKYNYDAIKQVFTKEQLAANKDLSIWRYKPLLPVNETSLTPNPWDRQMSFLSPPRHHRQKSLSFSCLAHRSCWLTEPMTMPLTCAFEICEQLDWKAPDVTFVSVGDGCIIGGIHKGLKDLLALGWIDRIPRLIGVQAEGSSYMYQAWKNNENIVTKPGIEARTIADSISAGLPMDRIKAMDAVNATKGAFITVSDEEIIRAIPDLAKKTGVFAEPAGAATWAGVKKAAKKGLLKSYESVVVINTGSGLKDINSAMKAVELTDMQYYKVEPSLNKFRKIASELKF